MKRPIDFIIKGVFVNVYGHRDGLTYAQISFLDYVSGKSHQMDSQID